MRLIAPATAVLVCLLSISVLIYLRCPYLTTASVDLAFHYDLTSFIFRNGAIPWSLFSSRAAQIPSLGIMTFYPPLSHAIAACVGHLFNSTLLAMNAVALTSTFLIYAVFVYIMTCDGMLVAPVLFGRLSR